MAVPAGCFFLFLYAYSPYASSASAGTETPYEPVAETAHQPVGPSGAKMFFTTGLTNPGGFVIDGVNPPAADIRTKLYNAAVARSIPPEILYGIAYQESGWRQFDGSGNPLISSDGGIGIMQVTSYGSYDVNRLKTDIDYNISAGADILIGKWNSTPIIGDNSMNCYENWFYAVWAYNGWVRYNQYPYKVWGLIASGPNGWWAGIPVTAVPQSWLDNGIGKQIPTPQPAHFWSPGPPPITEGSFIVYQGNVYRIAGGAPVYVSNWNVFGGPQPVVNVSDAQFASFPQYPRDGTFVLAGPNVYRIAGGAPIYVGNWNAVGGPQPFTTIDPFSVDNAGQGGVLSHLNYRPADGTFIRGVQTGRVYQVRGGAPYYVPSWDPFGGVQPFTDLDQYSIDNAGGPGVLSHLAMPHIDYHFSWYDNINASNWILMANPPGSTGNAAFNLSVAGKAQQLGSVGAGFAQGVVPESKVLYARYPGLMGGPVTVGATGKAIVSQRILWGSSLEEVLGTEDARLSDHYWWPWYDMRSPGYKNWVLVANPGTSTLTYHIKIAGNEVASGSLAPGQQATPTFPGQMGGPLEVTASAKVIASQRVLTNADTAFNEVPGIPDSELSDHYLWTWYDMQSPGAKDWVLVANPGTTSVTYNIKIAGNEVAQGTLDPGKQATPVFPALLGGPVEVTASARVIASQRVTWGPSFEEVPGYPNASLKTSYAWTWYDQKSPGASNWVLVANPGSQAVTYDVKIAGNKVASGTLNPGERTTPTFPGQMAGPVEVTASGPVMASQRVIWSGFFNEVVGS